MLYHAHTTWSGIVLGAQGGGGPPILTGATLDMNFVTGGYIGAQPSDLTVVRAQTVTSYAETAGGALVQFPTANTLRRTDKGLLIEEQRTNSAIRSQTFSLQINAFCSCVDNAALAPDGTMTASLQTGDGTNNNHASQNGSGNITFSSGSTYAFSVYGKPGTGNFLQILSSSTASFTLNPYATFNLTTGAVTQTGGSTDFVTAYTVPMADGWWRCVAVFTASGSAANSFLVGQSLTGVDGRGPAFTNVLTLYLWGDQCESVTMGGPNPLYASSYIPTTNVAVLRPIDNVQLAGAAFTAVSNRHTGTLYGEGVPAVSHNTTASRRLVEISNNNPNDRVFVAGSLSSMTGRTVISQTGATQADISGANLPIMLNFVNKMAVAWDDTVTTGNANLAVNGNLGTLDTAVVGPAALSTMFFGSESSLVATTCWNGYIRRVALWTTRQTDATLQTITTIDNVIAGASLDFNFVTGAYYGKPLSALVNGRGSSGYAETLTGTLTNFLATVNRITNKGFLSEESRTNIILQSQTLDNAAWVKSANGTGVTPVVTADVVAAPDGTLTADRIVFANWTDAGTGNFEQVYQNVVTTNSVSYTFSFYLRGAVGGEKIYIFAQDGGGAFAILGPTTLCTLTTSWQRFSITFTSGTAGQTFFALGFNGSGTGSQANQPGGTVYAWAGQGELGTFATSYIPTTTVAVTRSADVPTMTGTAFSDWGSPASTAGMMFCQFICPPDNGTARFICDISNGGSNDELFFAVLTGQTMQFQAKVGGSSQASLVTTTALTPGVRYKAAAAWTASDFAFYLNGSQIATLTGSGTIPSVNSLQLGMRAGNTLQADGYVERFAFVPNRGSNATMAAITGTAMPVLAMGINMSALEYAWQVSPTTANWDYVQSVGFRVVRLPVAWERLQPTLGAALNAAFLAQYQAAVAAATARGMFVIIDVHNYGTWDPAFDPIVGSPPGTYNHGSPGAAGAYVLGSANLTQAHFVDLWSRLATAFAGTANIGYGLMNEPRNLFATNLVKSSNHFANDQGNQAWFYANNPVLTPRAAASLSGFNDAWAMTDGNNFAAVSQAITLTAVSHTLSIEVASVSGTVACALAVDFAGSTAITATTTKTRYSKTFTPSAGSHSVNFQVNTNSGNVVRIANMQLNIGAGTAYTGDVWPLAAQAAITAIRAVDTVTPIYVPGDDFSRTEDWLKANVNLVDMVDPSNNLVFDSHCYFDKGGGAYSSTYDTINADGLGAGSARGVNFATPFVNFSTTYGKNIFVSEVAVPNDDVRWGLVMDGFQSKLGVQSTRSAMWEYLTTKPGDPVFVVDTGKLNIGRNNFSNAPQLAFIRAKAP